MQVFRRPLSHSLPDSRLLHQLQDRLCAGLIVPVRHEETALTVTDQIGVPFDPAGNDRAPAVHGFHHIKGKAFDPARCDDNIRHGIPGTQAFDIPREKHPIADLFFFCQLSQAGFLRTAAGQHQYRFFRQPGERGNQHVLTLTLRQFRCAEKHKSSRRDAE